MTLRFAEVLLGLCVVGRRGPVRSSVGVFTGRRLLVLGSGALGVLDGAARHEQPGQGRTDDETSPADSRVSRLSHGSATQRPKAPVIVAAIQPVIPASLAR